MPYQGEILAGMYQIIGEIGEGGAGVIYKAYHLNLGKYVVVKKLRETVKDVLDERGEADILKSLHHTFLPQVYDFLQLENGIYTVMDFIEGHDLKYYIDRGWCFDENTLALWLSQLSEVLSYLHSHQILHLDIKPANIMVTTEGNICLIDFNISLLGDSDSILGISGYYASPEQYRKWNAALYGMPDKEEPLDGRSDIYSLGASFYHLMTGYMPAPLQQEMIPLSHYALSYSRELIRIVEKMMAPARWRRWRNAEQLSRALDGMRRSKAEKRTLRTVFFSMLAGLTIVSAALFVMAYRDTRYVSAGKQEEILAEEQYLAGLCQSGEYEKAYQEGVIFLNEESRSVDKLQGARQSLLELLLEACMGMEDYGLARQYLQELFGIEEKAEYYQDEAVIAAWQGDYEEAEEALAKAEELGGEETAIRESIAELKAAQGDYPGALEIYQSLGENDTVILRRMAALALHAADTDMAFAELAVGYYERLKAENMASYADQMNLATAYGLCGFDGKASELLRGMRTEYPDRYEIALKLGILEYNAQMKKTLAERDLGKAAEYARTALELYENTEADGENAQLMELLRLIGQETD